VERRAAGERGDHALHGRPGAAARALKRLGYRDGGVFLAFPAILPATLTLIEKKEGRQRAHEDDVGATAGSVGLFAFALAGLFVVSRLDGRGAVALASAAIARLVVSIALYVVMIGLRKGRRRG
jgi:hypothetical protein